MATTKSAASVQCAPGRADDFVGRRRELSETRRLLASSRMLTLTGVGGVGKTRLALRWRPRCGDSPSTGCGSSSSPPSTMRSWCRTRWPTPSSCVRSPPTRPATSPPTSSHGGSWSCSTTASTSSACAMLASKLLAAAPDLRILATSRHVLGVEGEQILAVPPLSTPTARVEAETPLTTVGAAVPRPRCGRGARLRGRGRQPDAVVELCRRLDRIPRDRARRSLAAHPVTGADPRPARGPLPAAHQQPIGNNHGTRRSMPPWAGATSLALQQSSSCGRGSRSSREASTSRLRRRSQRRGSPPPRPRT